MDSPPRPELAAQLRRLRKGRGLTQRQMTALLGLTAHSAISDFESGRRIPQSDIIHAYELALGCPPGSLAELRTKQLRTDADCEFETAVARPPRPTAGEPSAAAAPTTTRPAPPGRRTLRPYRVLGVAAAVLATLVLSESSTSSRPELDATWAASTQNRTDHRESDTPPEPMDGDDPRARDCSADAVVEQSVPLYLVSGAEFGTLRLRHSRHCGASWASALYANPQLFTVSLTVYRPADGAEIRFDWNNNTPPGSYSDMLSTGLGCVWVEATVRSPDGTGPAARTQCLR